MAKKKSYVVPIIILVVAVGVSVGGVMYVSKLGVDDATLSAVNNTSIQPFVTSNPGQTGTFTLPGQQQGEDRSRDEALRAGRFPDEDSRDSRRRHARSFEVAPTTEAMPLPFRLVAKRNHVIATGTRFAVSAYPGDSAIFVTVKEGTVQVKSMKTEATRRGESDDVRRAGDDA